MILLTRGVLHQQTRDASQSPLVAQSQVQGLESMRVSPCPLCRHICDAQRSPPLSLGHVVTTPGWDSHPAPVLGQASPSQSPGPAASSPPGIFLQESSWRGTSLGVPEERTSEASQLELGPGDSWGKRRAESPGGDTAWSQQRRGACP